MSAGEIQLSSPEATRQLAAEVSAKLLPGDIVLLSGELGVGKTSFVRGAVEALGITDPVSSPTFAIAHSYQGETTSVAHLDLYRLAGSGSALIDSELIDEAVADESIAFVEWPQALPKWLLPRVVLEIELAHLGTEARLARLRWR